MMTFNVKRLLAVALLPAAVSAAAEVQMHAERVALFKNGYACVQMRGTLGSDDKVQVRHMPTPVFGALRWDAPVNVLSLRGLEREVESTATAFGFRELLRANEGKCAVIELKNGEVCQGIVELPPQAETGSGGSFIRPMRYKPAESRAHTVTVHTMQGSSICLGIGEIRSVEFAAGENPDLPTQKQKITELEVDLESAAPGGDLRLSCLAEGISWLPTYSVALGEEAQAHICCRATIINDLVDLENAELQLVSGAPALGRFLVADALANPTNALNIIGLFGGEIEVGRESGMGVMSNLASLREMKDASRNPESAANRLSRAEDLYYCTIPNFTCRRGETLMLPVFELTAPYKHVFTCAVPNQHRLQQLSRSGSPIAEVFHCVRLTNCGEAPWSAGVATCTSNGWLVGRSSIQFTAGGQECLLPLSLTFDISVSCREAIEKQGIPRHKRGQNSANGEQVFSVYHGYLTLKNQADKPVEMELTKEISGSATAASDSGEIDVTPSYSGNANSVISWKVTLEPGEEKTFTYSYQYLP